MAGASGERMFSSSNTRLTLLSLLTVLVGFSISIAPVLADGAVLQHFDAPTIQQGPKAIYFPIGITFDGQNLYYSQPSVDPNRIFHITPSGTVLSTLTSVAQAGALAWDGSHLWVGIFASPGMTCSPGVSGCALLYQVDPSTGSVLKTVDVSSIFAADQECNFIDGLSFDPARGTLWVSPDPGCLNAVGIDGCSIGFAYNVDTSGNLKQRLTFPFGVSGVAVEGNFLYVVDRCGTGANSFVKVDRNGLTISSFPLVRIDQHTWAESIAFDPVSFAPSCALWAIQPYFTQSFITFHADIVAYQIACP